jgi:hypothetical protein
VRESGAVSTWHHQSPPERGDQARYRGTHGNTWPHVLHLSLDRSLYAEVPGLQGTDSGLGPTSGEASNLLVGPTSFFPAQLFQNMTLTGAAAVRFCKWTGVHSTLAHRAIVCPLADEALQ